MLLDRSCHRVHQEMQQPLGPMKGLIASTLTRHVLGKHVGLWLQPNDQAIYWTSPYCSNHLSVRTTVRRPVSSTGRFMTTCLMQNEDFTVNPRHRI